MDDLQKDQCGVCGDYICGNPPYQWESLPSASGPVQACRQCFSKFKDRNVADPRKTHRHAILSHALDRADAEVARLEAMLDELD